MKRWIVYNKKGDFEGIAKRHGIDQVTARCLINRDIPEEKMDVFLHPQNGTLYDAHLLKGAEIAARLLKDAIEAKKKIRIIGDYDVDGVISTYILKHCISLAGGDVDYDIPHRMRDGYGLNRRLCEKAIADGIELVITCDNGIKAFDEIKLLKDAGLTVIVTDHHTLDFTETADGREYLLPAADITVNPHQPGETYPFAAICGAVVAWKVMIILMELFGKSEEAKKMLPFAAFATVCDIMPLVDENRTLVAQGLNAFSDIDNVGMRALMEDRSRADGNINAFDLGFLFGPCFNACGRLDSAMKAVALLEEESVTGAMAKAKAMAELNDKRKKMTEDGTNAALALLSGQPAIDPVIIVYLPDLHESLAGIVAGRIREKYYRPVFVLCDGEQMVKGSGRSIEGYPMSERLHEVEDLLEHYGGHPMAAGLSLRKENLDELRRRLIAGANLEPKDLEDTLWIDAPMPLSYLSESLVEELARLEPFGQSNERPVFAQKDLAPVRMLEVGRTERKYLKFIFRMKNGTDIDGMYFGDAQEMKEYLENKFGKDEIMALMEGRKNNVRMTISYYPNINEYRGRRNLQIRIEEYL